MKTFKKLLKTTVQIILFSLFKKKIFILALYFWKLALGFLQILMAVVQKKFLVTWDKRILPLTHTDHSTHFYGDETLNQLISNLVRHLGSLIKPTAIYGWADPSSSDAPLSVLLRNKQGLHAMIGSLWSPPFCLLRSRKNEPVTSRCQAWDFSLFVRRSAIWCPRDMCLPQQ